MLRNLLVDRFRLKANRETREIPVYTLSTAKERREVQGKFRTAGRLSSLVDLQNRLNSIVIDKTGLTGRYVIDVSDANAIPQPDDPPLPALQTALEQDLGLKLEKTKAPYDVVVIDRIDKKLTEN